MAFVTLQLLVELNAPPRRLARSGGWRWLLLYSAAWCRRLSLPKPGKLRRAKNLVFRIRVGGRIKTCRDLLGLAASSALVIPPHMPPRCLARELGISIRVGALRDPVRFEARRQAPPCGHTVGLPRRPDWGSVAAP